MGRMPAVMAAMLLVAVTGACGSDPDDSLVASSAAPAPAVRPYCQTALPSTWQEAIDASEVETGGVATVPLAVGPAGEVAAVRDNGDTRDLLVIDADGSVDAMYQVPEPNLNDVGFVAMDQRWVVVGVDRIPRNSNGVLPSLIRIDVIDREGGGVRTVVQRGEEDYRSGGPAIDSVALFGDAVYWVTRDSYASGTGTLRSFDLASGAVADVDMGTVSLLRTTAAGLVWRVDAGQISEDDELWKHTAVKLQAELPAPVSDALATESERLSLTTDGTAYAWLTGVEQGTTGVSWWSPETGLVRVTGDVVGRSTWLPELHVDGPLVVIDRGRQDAETGEATVVDTRSGAVTYLDDRVADAGGGTIAFHLGPYPNKGMTMPGVLRTEKLQPQTCP